MSRNERGGPDGVMPMFFPAFASSRRFHMNEEKEGQQSGVSRRNFLRGSIVTVAAAVPALTLMEKAEAASRAKQ